MTEFARQFAANHQPPSPAPRQGKPNRKQLDKKSTNEIYLLLKQLYLKENPQCARPGCLHEARFIHHVVSGMGGKARSLLNTDTWLAVCSDECHDHIERLHDTLQRALKQECVRETIERLRR